MCEGWVKSYRKILDNPIVCKDADYFAVWNYLLLSATHKEIPALFKGQKITLMPGQLITGRKVISEKFRVSESKVYRILNAFKSEQQIEQQTSNQNSLITILNWEKYQDSEQQIEQPVNNKRTASEQPVNTNKNERMKECNKSFKYYDNEALNNTFLQYIEFRKKIRATMTDRAIELAIKKLNDIGKTDEERVAIINQSIMNGWKGLFELKQVSTPKSTNKFNDFPQRKYEEDKMMEFEQLLNRR